MIVAENLRLALGAIRANKLRSFLTTLGIIIGVAAVIAVVSLVQGLERMVTKELEGVGATFMEVAPDFADQTNSGPGIVPRQVRLTWDDGQAILARVPGIRVLTPVVMGKAQVKLGDRSHTPYLILGVNENWPEVRNHAVEEGRFLSRLDLERRKNVVVIGRTIVSELRLGSRPIGKEIYVGRYPATVIGVMEKKGHTLGEDLDDLVFVPFDAAVLLFGRNARDLVRVRLQVERADLVPQVRDAITGLLRQRHKIAPGQPDDFRIRIQDEILRSTQSILGNITAVVAGVVGIALLVGGIGIMNIMLVSVRERTREIGVRKAVGARRQDVLAQFLIEAVTLSLAGGAIGLALGYGAGLALSKVLPGDWPTAHVPLWAVALAFLFSAFVGIFFGSYPASRAARLDPIESLRFE
ncbi:MAG TPA: ABC transporter permease [Thermoanaerobaculia bacterium]|nr:ABC transporter permease [Thermoanaerobaculia bacterium]